MSVLNAMELYTLKWLVVHEFHLFKKCFGIISECSIVILKLVPKKSSKLITALKPTMLKACTFS